MITLIIGENAYERDQAVAKIIAGYEGDVERHDGQDVSVENVYQFMQGVSLFTTKRLLVVRGLSDNKDAWDELASQLSHDNDDTHLVLVEPKPDKRTKTYKELQKHARRIECLPFSERDTARVATWLEQVAKERNVLITKEAASMLVQRVGVDQYMLLHELDRLQVMGGVTRELVELHTEQTAVDTAFALLEMALGGDAVAVQQKVQRLRTSEDAYMTFGLLVSQIYALAGLVVANGQDVAKELGVHPFVLSKLRPVAQRLTATQIRNIVGELSAADTQLKSSSIEPWLVLETTLTRIAEKSTT